MFRFGVVAPNDYHLQDGRVLPLIVALAILGAVFLSSFVAIRIHRNISAFGFLDVASPDDCLAHVNQLF